MLNGEDDTTTVTGVVNILKRKRSIGTSLEEPGVAEDTLSRLADLISGELDALPIDDHIHGCGQAAVSILATNPQYALELAKDKINAWEYRRVPYCWLRLYEDSSLYEVVSLLRSAPQESEQWLDRIVGMLDRAIITSGGFGRAELFASAFERLQQLYGHLDGVADLPDSLTVVCPRVLVTEHGIPGADALSLANFQLHMDHSTTPLLIRGLIDEWPAMTSWQKTSHLLRHTLGGRRLVPVEIGKTYMHTQWRQQLMPFRQYMEKYLLPTSPDEIGYMGQHDLFRQIPSLRSEITIPDYCYTYPPDKIPESLVGLPPAAELSEPRLNAWLGPRCTRSPLHHDPYHNIFCQVVGHKYVRLYPPSATTSLYPRAMDEKGISLSNTSSVDIQFKPDHAGNVLIADEVRCPLFSGSKNYQEAIVGPGESLYIPAGWWHYIESLTASFSVSFWWN